MKGAIKLLLIFMILSGFRTTAFAQSTADETITASATVIQAITVGAIKGDLNFETVLTNSTKTINVLDGSVDAPDAVVDGSETRGYFKVDFAESRDIELTLEFPDELEGEGENRLSFSPLVDESVSEIQAFATRLNFSTNQSLDFSTETGNIGVATTAWSVTGNEAAATYISPPSFGFYVVVGGTVTAEATQVPGLYSGEITLTAAIPD